jgi:hypothetical protein
MRTILSLLYVTRTRYSGYTRPIPDTIVAAISEPSIEVIGNFTFAGTVYLILLLASSAVTVTPKDLREVE